MDTPSGYLYMRPDHQAYKDAVTGFSKNLPQYEFAAWDPDRIITIPIRNITAPMGWPKPAPAITNRPRRRIGSRRPGQRRPHRSGSRL